MIMLVLPCRQLDMLSGYAYYLDSPDGCPWRCSLGGSYRLVMALTFQDICDVLIANM